MKLVSVRQVFNFQVYISHVRIWAKYFQTLLPLSFDLLWEYRALVYFLELAPILCWLVNLILYALRQLFVITQSLFKPPFIILLSFASQFWAVKKYYPFCFDDKPHYKPIDQKNNDLPSLELGNSSQSLGNKISLGLLMELATSKFGVGIRRTITTKKKKKWKRDGKTSKNSLKNSLLKKYMKKKEPKGTKKW